MKKIILNKKDKLLIFSGIIPLTLGILTYLYDGGRTPFAAALFVFTASYLVTFILLALLEEQIPKQ